MKTIVTFVSILTCLLTSPLHAVVSVVDITAIEFNTLNNTYPKAWKSAKFQAGGISGQLSYEMLLSVPGYMDVYGEHTWNHPDSITVSRDLNGTMYMTAGSDTISQTITLPFNTLLMRVVDMNTILGDVTFKNIYCSTNSYGVVSIPDIAINENSRYVRIDLDETNPIFQFTGKLDLEMTDSNRAYVELIGLQVSVPEINSFILFILSLPTFFFSRRR